MSEKTKDAENPAPIAVNASVPSILVVDDDDAMRYMLVRLMQKEGYRTLETDNGKKALAMVEESMPSAILLDSHLPGIDGIEVCSRIRRIAGGDSVPILVITAQNTQEHVEDAFKAGATDYITKPVHMAVLKHRVRRLLHGMEADRRLKETLQQIALTKIEWEATTNSLAQCICLVDGKRKVVRANRTLEGWLTVHDGQIGGKKLHDLFHPGCDNPKCYLVKLLDNAWERLEKGFPTEEEAWDSHLMRHLQFHVQPIADPLMTEGTQPGSAAVISIADITRHKETQKQLSRTIDQLATLRQVDVELVRKLDINYVMLIALDAAMRVSGATAGYVGIIEGEARAEEDTEEEKATDIRLHIARIQGKYPDAIKNNPHLTLEDGILALACSEKHPRLITEVSYIQDDIHKNLRVPDTEAMMIVPLVSRRNLVGVLTVETSTGENFTPEIFDMVRLLASRVAVALDNARLYEISRNQLTELEMRNEELDAYNHTIAHDLKAPLNLIIGYAYGLNRKYADNIPEEGIGFLKGIRSTAAKMGHMIEQLLTMAKLRDVTQAAVTVNANEAAQAAVDRFKNRIEEEKIAIEVMPDLPPCLGHTPWLEEILANLVGNAINYMGENNAAPSILIRGMPWENNTVRYLVTDNGVGIAAKDQERLFQMFTRLETTSAKGTGLGLSIVQRMVKRMNGKLGVESEEGKGSTFWFAISSLESGESNAEPDSQTEAG